MASSRHPSHLLHHHPRPHPCHPPFLVRRDDHLPTVDGIGSSFFDDGDGCGGVVAFAWTLVVGVDDDDVVVVDRRRVMGVVFPDGEEGEEDGLPGRFLGFVVGDVVVVVVTT